MIEKTNLERVKSVARMLLLTPVHKTPYSPVVVQHPFTSCGIATAKKDGILQIIDITESEENLKWWQEWMKEWIKNAKSAYEIYMMTNKPYGLTFLKYVEPYLSIEDFSKILGDAWIRSENPNGDANVTKKELLSMFKKADKKTLMTEEDYKRWQGLDETITVYRGVTSHNSVVVTAGEDVEVILTKNGTVVEYTLGEAITEIGDYSLEITDSLGNTESRNFTIVAPIVREFTHNFDDVPGFEKVLVNGEDKRLNYGTLELFADGVYEVGVVVDGETYFFTVTVDSTLPEITLVGVENVGATNGNVTIATTEETATLTVYLNGEEIVYTVGDELTAEGEYRAVATELAGNSVEVTFTIDKTAPVLTLTGVENGGITNGNVTISAVDYATVVVYLNDAEIEYTLGGELTEEGSYFVQAWDAVGNVSETVFTIDKSAPAIALKGVANAGKTNSNVTITVADDATEFKVFLNGKEISYKAGKELKDEGAYKATVKDELGNTVEVSFIIDKTAATLVLNGVENGGKTKGEVSLTDLSETATVVVVKDGETVAYTLGELLNEVGRYAITVTDTCGNVSEYSFEITKGISGWAITGIVVGSLVVIAGAVFIILKKRGTI